MPAWTRARHPSAAAARRGGHAPRRVGCGFFGAAQGVCGGVPLTDQTPMPPPHQIRFRARRTSDQQGRHSAHRFDLSVRRQGATDGGVRWMTTADGRSLHDSQIGFDCLWAALHAFQTRVFSRPVAMGGMGVNLRGVPALSIRRLPHFISGRAWQRGGSASAARRCCSLLSSYLLGAETHRKPLPCSGLWGGSTDALPP